MSVKETGSVHITSTPMRAINLMNAALRHPSVQQFLGRPSDTFNHMDVSWDTTEAGSMQFTVLGRGAGVGGTTGYFTVRQERGILQPEEFHLYVYYPYAKAWTFGVKVADGDKYILTPV